MNYSEVFNDSYERCCKHDEFLDIFYRSFLKKNESFRQMFVNVDMEKQMRMVKASIVMIFLASTSDLACESLRIYARRHGFDGLNLNPIDFDIGFNCLLEAVSFCDHLYDDHVKEAWQVCFREGIAIMKGECCTANLP